MLYAEDGGIERMLQDLSAQEKFDFIEWIRDVIRKLINKVKGIDTSFEDELRSLEQKFTKMLNETTKNEKNTGEGVELSISEIIGKSGKNYGIGVILDSTLLSNLTDSERIKMIKEYIKKLGGTQFSAFDKKGNKILIKIAESNKKIKNKKGKNTPVNKDLTTKHIKNKTKQETITLLDELILTASFDTEKASAYSHGWIDNYGESNWEYWTTYAQDTDGNIWEVTLNIANTNNSEKILYDIGPIKKVERSVKSDTISTNNSISNSQKNVNKKLSVAPETDAEYMSAVENGDMKTAQKMVDKAAKDAGYLRKGYHGSPNRFYIFKRSKIGKTTDPGIYGRGFYFSDQESQAWEYANQNNKKGDVRSFFIKINNPFEIKSDEDYLAFEDIYMGPLAKAEANGEILTEERIGELLEEGTQKLIDMGYDGVIYYGKGQKEYVTFESEQSKLSDAVVYDDQGNVIPLSERFNEKKKDIRWSTSSQSNKKSLPKYTKEQYNNFGWTRYDNILSAKQIKMLDEKLYELSKRNIYFNKTSDGQYIIPIGEDYGLYNVLVYTNGDAINPKISKIVKLAHANDELELIWKELLDGKELTERTINEAKSYVDETYGEWWIEKIDASSRTPFRTFDEERKRNERTTSGRNIGRENHTTFRRWDIGEGFDTESERDTTGNTQNDVKSSITSTDSKGTTSTRSAHAEALSTLTQDE